LLYEAETVALLGRGVDIGPNCVVGCAGVTKELLGELDMSLDGAGTGTLLGTGIMEGAGVAGVLPVPLEE